MSIKCIFHRHIHCSKAGEGSKLMYQMSSPEVVLMSSLRITYHPKENIILLYGCINVPKVGQPDTGGLQSIKSSQSGVDIPHRYTWFPESSIDLFRFPATLAKKQLISIWTVILRVPWVSKHSSPKQSAKVFQTLQPDELNGWSHQGVRTMIPSLAYLKPTLWVEVGIHISATSKNLKAGLLEMWKILGRSPKTRILCLQTVTAYINYLVAIHLATKIHQLNVPVSFTTIFHYASYPCITVSQFAWGYKQSLSCIAIVQQ